MIKTVLGRIVGDAADGIDPDQVSMEYTHAGWPAGSRRDRLDLGGV
ncbi:MAG: hypothetical protein WKF83_08135 [Nocardioidaceae bacterium]